MEDLKPPFDAIIVGTGLCQSILAAALAKKGKRILHIDKEDRYGSFDASYSLQELLEWAREDKDASTPFSNRKQSLETLPDELAYISRRFALALRPAVIPAICPLVDALVASGVAAYSGFRLVESLVIYSEGSLKRIPSSKEDIFKTDAFSLIEKRRLMKFIQFATGDIEGSEQCRDNPDIGTLLTRNFGLTGLAREATLYGIAFGVGEIELAIPVLQRLRKYLISTGRFGSSPFLLGQYGGSCELLQGFCRACAVSGGYYMLNQQHSVGESRKDSLITIDLPKQIPVQTQWLVDLAPPAIKVYTSRAIVILNKPLDLPAEHKTLLKPADVEVEDKAMNTKTADNAIICFPPTAARANPVWAILQGEGTFVCPENYNVVQLVCQHQQSGNPEDMLKPVLDILLPTTTEPSPIVYSLFFTDMGGPDLVLTRASGEKASFPQNTANFGELGDDAVANALCIFREITEDSEAPLFTPAPSTDDED